MPRIRKIPTLPIGTVFTYNGKQYKVVEIKSAGFNCFEHCALYSNCTKAEKVRGYCISSKRKDHKDVYFIEISKPNEDIIMNTVIPTYKDNISLNDIKIECPKGFIIDKENSDFNKGIIKFKRDDITISDIYTSISLDNFSVNVVPNSSKTFPKIFAITKLMDIARYYNGNWDFNHANNDWGYYIKYVYPNNTYEVDNTIICNLGVPYFKNEEDAQAVIDNHNFRDILDTIFK